MSEDLGDRRPHKPDQEAKDFWIRMLRSAGMDEGIARDTIEGSAQKVERILRE